MIDYVNTKLKVAEIKYEKGYKRFVMEPVPDLHKHRHVLYDNSGNRYQPVCASCGRNDDGLTVYTFEFNDLDTDIPVGTELAFEAEEWRKKIPDSKIKSVRFVQNTYSFPDFRILRGLDLVVNSTGDVSMTTPKTAYQKRDRRISFLAEEEEIRGLFDDLLTCVSGNSCYCEQWIDDTGREMTIVFENGKEYRYSTVFYNSEEKTNVKFIFDFLKRHENRNDFICSSIEPEKSWYRITFTDEGEGDAAAENRKIIRKARRLKMKCELLKSKDEEIYAVYTDRYGTELLLSALDSWRYDCRQISDSRIIDLL